MYYVYYCINIIRLECYLLTKYFQNIRKSNKKGGVHVTVIQAIKRMEVIGYMNITNQDELA